MRQVNKEATMTPRMFSALVRKMMWAQDHGDHLTCILIAGQLRKAIAEGTVK